MDDGERSELARRVIEACSQRGDTIATAESCTGGLIAAALTDIAGSSRVFDRGFVTYSNEAKQEMIGVDAKTLRAHGAVSREVALEMAAGARERAGTTFAVAVTGIAGPGGASTAKPVGLVHFGWATPSGLHAAERRFGALSRSQIRRLTVVAGLQFLLHAATAEDGRP